LLIIFDCDGVLVDSETIAAEVLTAHLNKHGLNVTQAQTIARYRGKSARTCMADIAVRIKHLPDDFWARMQADTFTEFERNLQPVKGVPELLRFLQARSMRFCIASSGDHEKLQLTLGKTQLLPYFQGCIYSATEVVKGKPAADLFLYAAQQMGVAAKDCIVIEDSLAGVQAGINAGMRVIAYSAGGGDNDEAGNVLLDQIRALGVEVLDSMSELQSLLKNV